MKVRGGRESAREREKERERERERERDRERAKMLRARLGERESHDESVGFELFLVRRL